MKTPVPNSRPSNPQWFERMLLKLGRKTPGAAGPRGCAALRHNYGCFVTGAHDGLPGGADREQVAVATGPGRTYFFLLAGGVLAALVAGYLLAGGGWFRPVLGTVTAENPGSPAKVASGDFLAVLLQMPLPGRGAPMLSATLPPVASAVMPDPAYPRLNAAVKTDLGEESAARVRAQIVLPPIWHEEMRFTWFRQIGELGRMSYEPVPDSQGLPFNTDWIASGETPPAVFN